MDKAAQEELYRRLGIGLAELDADPRFSAVLVVDFQRLFTVGPLASTGTADALARTRTLLERARAEQVPVFYARVVYDEPDQAGPVWSVKSPTMRTCLRGTNGVEIDPVVAPQAGDRVIDKRRASAFFKTSLDAELRALGVTTVLLAGTSTSGCVRATAVDGCSLDYRMLVVRECVEDRAGFSEEAALFDLDAKYADVVGLERAFELLDRRREANERRRGELSPGGVETSWK
jgi:maleamate amidohydrolase